MRQVILAVLLMFCFALSGMAQQVVSGITQLNGQASDPESGLTGQLSFYLGATWVCDSAPVPMDGDTVFVGGCAWDTTLSPEGPDNLTAKIFNVAGLEGTSDAFPVDVSNPDNTPPTVEILSVVPAP